jgi:hypothetical protein
MYERPKRRSFDVGCCSIGAFVPIWRCSVKPANVHVMTSFTWLVKMKTFLRRLPIMAVLSSRHAFCTGFNIRLLTGCRS